MRRREFVTLLGSAAVWPVVARAQPASMPVIGFLHSGSAATNAKRLDGFRKGLAEAGFVEGRNVAIEFRWAEGRNDRLPELAADLTRRQVAAIATPSSTVAALAAQAATTTIPIVFIIAEDPVKLGLVQSLGRPNSNATGFSTLNMQIATKRIGLLRELVPQTANIALLVDPNNPNTKPLLEYLQGTMQFQVLGASSEREIEDAYRTLKPGDALLVSTNPFFFLHRAQLVALAARHRVAAIYDNREFADAGGLMSYGTDLESLWGQAGIYVGRILKGEKPADLPVTQPTKFELVINLKTAKALGLEIPSKLLFTADEVIE